MRSPELISKKDCTWAVTDALRIYDGHNLFKTIPLDDCMRLIADVATALTLAGRTTLVISKRQEDPPDNPQG